jgi:hypothetical protein
VSNKSTLRFLVVLLFAAFSSAALVLAEAGTLVQNANSSTTEESAQDANMNANMSAPRRGRRGRRRPATAPNPNGVLVGDAPAAQDDSRGDLSGEMVDLSGTYTGHVTMTGGHEMSGDATLTITGNTFTLAGEGMTHNGRVYAVVTRGYIGAAFYFSDITDPASNTALAANVRARKSGDRLTLSPVPGSRNRLTFAPARGRR